MAKKTVWIYTYVEEHEYEPPSPIVFLRKEEALRHAADVIKDVVNEQKTRFEWGPDDPNVGELDDILKAIQEGKLEEAVDAWESYRKDYDAEETISVVEARVADAP